MSDAAAEKAQQLVTGASLGEEWAWNALHRDLSPALRGYVVGCGVADPDAVVGEALVRLARDLAGAEATFEEAVVWAFLHARAILHERRQLDIDAGRPTGTPSLVVMALAPLSQAQREVLLLRVTARLDDDETATVLGITPEAVRELVRDALGVLADGGG